VCRGDPVVRAVGAGAELLRVPEIGTVQQGKAADLCLYEGNPLDQVETVLKPALVMRSGEVAAGTA